MASLSRLLQTQRAQKTVAVFALIVAVFAVNPAFSQTFPLQIQVSVMPPYSAYLQDYPGTGQQVRVFIINTSRNTYQIRLSGQLTGDNGIEVRTSPNYRPQRPVTIPPGQTLLTRNDLEGLFDLNQIEVTGIDKNLLARGLPLPDGTYQLCVRAYNETATNTATVAFGQPLSAEFPIGCSAPIVVKSVEPPILISPLCDAEVIATNPQTVVFTWTPPAGVSPVSVEYTLRVVELPQVDVDPNVFIDAVALPKSGVEVRNLRTSTFLYGPTQPLLVAGKRYAWRVQAIDRSGKLNFLNDGKSPVCAFTYGKDSPVPPALPILVQSTDTSGTKKVFQSQTFVKCECTSELSGEEGSVADNQSALVKKQIMIAGFTVALSPDAKLDNQKLLQGTGTVPIPYAGSGYLKIRVRLKDIQCNAAGQAIAGTVRGLNNTDPKLLPGYDQPNFSGLNLSPGNVSTISTVISGLKDQVIQSAKDWKNSIGWEMPLGVYTSKVDVAITNITFEPRKAYFDANLWLKVPSAQFGGVPLSAAHVCLSPGKPICGDMTLFLGADTPLSTYVSLKGAVANMNEKPSGPLDFQKITSVNLTNWEFKTFHIVAGMKPPGLKRADNDKEVELTLTYDAPKADLTDWTASVDFPEFYVTTLTKDFTFSMDGKPGVYDHSELPDVYTNLLPNNYPLDGQKPGADWKGLFFPKLKVKTTLLKSLNNGQETSVSVENMIYDDNGFTGSVVAGADGPIITLGNGSLDGWYCSADELRLNIKLSKFESSSLTGRVVMPIFKYTKEQEMEKASMWPYTCTLSKDNGNFSYQFTITPPKEEAKVALWRAKLSIKDGTNITIGNKGGSFNASATLNLALSVDAKIISPGMGIEGMKLQSSPPDGSSFFTPGLMNAKFASPQKAMLAPPDEGGFPVTISQVGLRPVQNETKKFDFVFTGNMTLMEGNVKASVTPYVRFSMGTVGLSKRPDWQFDKVGVDKVKIHGNLSFIRVDGEIDFFEGLTENQINYGDGFKSDGISMTMLGVKATVKGYFGRVNGFRYWQVGGLANLPAPLPIPGTPLSFKAFGGGVFSNMEKITTKDAKGQPVVGAPVSFKPQKDKLGFEVATEVILQDESLLDMNGVMTATMSTNNGLHLSALRLDLNAAMLGPKPTDALATGVGALEVNFDQGFFDGGFNLKASYKAPVGGFSAKGEGDLGMHINFSTSPGNSPDTKQPAKQKQENWYFYLGLPDATPCDNLKDCFESSQRVKLTMTIPGTSFTFGTYFIMYKGVPPTGVTLLPPPPWGISAGDLAALGYKGGQKAGTSALAFGAGFIKHDDVSFGPFEVDFDMNLGFDLALQKVSSSCGNGRVPGVNGWYANGQLYASLALTLGINIDVWIYSGYLELLKVQATALLEGGMVNPIWLHGSILLRYRALGGRIKGHTTFELWYNKDEQCKPAFEQPNPFADLPIIAGMTPDNNSTDVSVITPYYAEFSYPVRTLIQINDVDPDTKKPVAAFRTFRLDFTSGTPANPFVTQQVQASSSNPTCQLDNSGKLRFGSDPDGGGNFNVSFFRDVTLPPNAKFAVSLTVQVQLRNAGGGYDPYEYPKGSKKLVTDTKSYTFTTGECVSSLTNEGESASVAYSFPFEGQRYYTIGDGGISGYVELAANFGCCLEKIQNDQFYKLSVRYTALKGGKFDRKDPGTVWTSSNVKFDGKLLRFGIPINFLQKKTLYRLEIFREPSDALVAAQKKLIDDRKGAIRKELDKNYGDGEKAEFGFGSDKGATASAKPGAGLPVGKIGSVNGLAQAYNSAYIDQSVQQFSQSSVSVKDQAVSTATDMKISKGKTDEVVDVKTQLEQPVYSYFFQTSQYNTLGEKLQATQFLTGEQQSVRSNTIEVYTVPMQGAEGFDTYELNWKTLPNGNILPPLMLQQVVDKTNSWFADFVQPMVNLVNNLAIYKQSDGNILFKSSANTQSEAVDYNRLLRQMVQYSPAQFDNAQKPISKKDLKGISIN